MATGNVIIMADFNAHVPNHSLAFAFILNGDFDDHVPLPSDIYCPDIPLTRNTMELRELNQNCESLIDMCKSISVRLVNGRVAGDNCCKFTRSPFTTVQMISHVYWIMPFQILHFHKNIIFFSVRFNWIL